MSFPKACFICLFLFFLSVTRLYADTDRAVVVWMDDGGCDYFIADGPSGLYVLEWYGGYWPSEGDEIIGEIGSFGMKDVYYPGFGDGRVWVEDYLESERTAFDEIRDHC